MKDIEKFIESLEMENYFQDNKISWYLDKQAKKFFIKMIQKLNFEWLKEYEVVADWMDTNNGYGLIMIGNTGRGKTVIAKKILPMFFRFFFDKEVTCYNSYEINDKLDEILKKRIVIIDDIGSEDQSVVFGERKWVLPIIMDNVEKSGNLIILTTNLNVEMITQKYGERTRERIKACCRAVLFKGASLRKNIYDK